MTLYRTLTHTRPCDGCQEPLPFTVQFKTGGTDNLEHYEPKDVPDEAVPHNTPLQGWMDRYCSPCQRKRKLEEFDGLYKTLGKLIEEGPLDLRHGWLFKRSYTPDGIRQLGRIRKEAFEKDRDKRPPRLFQDLEHLTIIWHGKTIQSGSSAYAELLDNLNNGIAQWLEHRQWSSNPLIQNNLAVIWSTDRQQWIVETQEESLSIGSPQ